MPKFKIFLCYTGYWIAFALTFTVMFALLTTAAAGIPFGVMLVIYGTAALIFKEDLIITELAAPCMLFGGLAAIFLTAACGFAAVKLGFLVSRRFLKVRRRCDRLRALAETAPEDGENDLPPSHEEENAAGAAGLEER